MTQSKNGAATIHVLATDLDGTLIPLAGSAENRADLQLLGEQLKKHDVTLIDITGRHRAYAERAIAEHELPPPDWLICDVGTSIYHRDSDGEFQLDSDYQDHQDRIIAPLPIAALRKQLAEIDGLRLQEEEKQGRFKLSYYADANRLETLVDQIQHKLDHLSAPYTVIQSVDPFNGDGLIDLLPQGVSKAHALSWLVDRAHFTREAVVFSGDSGNDFAALTAGYRAVVVGNAERKLARRVYDAHREKGWRNRLYLARGAATSGVLEGCRWFGLADPPSAATDRLGATPITQTLTHFRVWAPPRNQVAVEIRDGESRGHHELARDDDGYFSDTIAGVRPDALYEFVLDGGVPRPDPASRYQPHGVHGASQIVDPGSFPWTDHAWPGVAKSDLIIYELHVGAFTRAGTFRAAIERIPELVGLGVTAVEIMPVAQSPGRWNWGYDGVDMFAPRNTYGEPNDMRAFVDACHAAGLAVILDVVYNHLGPEGNYLAEYGPYFSRKHHTPWGDALNFDGPQSEHVRRFIIDNAIYWLDEFHLDGLRLDAVHFMLDDRRPDILADIRAAVTQFADTLDRRIHLIAEANIYDPALLETGDQPSYDAIWCDCLMHSLYTLGVPDLQLTHRTYRGSSDLAEVLQHGYLYAGVRPVRCTPEQRAELHPHGDAWKHISSFVTALQTHDAIGNHPHGKRLHQLTSKAFQRAAAALALLYPSIPLIFMGEESAVESPFAFFVDFEDVQLRQSVDQSRAQEYPQHVWEGALSPSQAEVFYGANIGEGTERDAEMFDWYCRLIAFRKQGIAAGWLTPQRMSTSHDEPHGLFRLQFARDDGGTVDIQVRLAAAAAAQEPAVPIAVNGEVLLCSAPDLRVENGHVQLHANQAVISRS